MAVKYLFYFIILFYFKLSLFKHFKSMKVLYYYRTMEEYFKLVSSQLNLKINASSTEVFDIGLGKHFNRVTIMTYCLFILLSFKRTETIMITTET